jgi:hypothetical protein
MGDEWPTVLGSALVTIFDEIDSIYEDQRNKPPAEPKLSRGELENKQVKSA